ncbi:heptaprenyl diphosphate synthase component 1 [Ornithinibacillus gellani]|uniref:heptaprenyl diphosphate synthase component 1 n=1 Tax=Ornithinibacillus gellani TaxID=2293253 RepID=UPI0016805202|nr:heptaprenyl diphosphate synthase component 1 [Ornithinibacillus gellani]
MQELNREINHLKNIIENRMKHTYLNQFVQTPEINDYTLFILYSILKQAHVPESRLETIVTTTMLIQIALDAHDQVVDDPNLSEHSPEAVTNQLTVLAGDYYSGLYYLLLSETRDFKLIQTLASAIKKINELKMHVYFKEYQSPLELFEMLKRMESLLIIHVAEFVGFTEMNDFAEKVALLWKANHPLENSVHPIVDEPAYKRQEYLDSLMKDADLELTSLPSNFIKIKAYFSQQLKAIKLGEG